MKRLLLFSLILLLSTYAVFGQEQYTIDGQTYNLNTEVEGPLTLLWNTIDGKYRFFVKKGDEIAELKNSREGKTYQEEYKEVLKEKTADISMNVSKVNLTLGSLRSFFHSYNSRKDPTYTYTEGNVDFRFRLGAFGGVMNNIYYANPGNKLLFQAGVDFEMIEHVKLRRHSLLLQFRQVFSSSDYDFTSTQLSLNYRFKFVQNETIDIFVNVKMAAYTFIDRTVEGVNIDNELVTLSGSAGTFQGPLAFGLGTDIPVGNGFISIAYNDIFSLTAEGNGEFPTDFTVGYKFNL